MEFDGHGHILDRVVFGDEVWYQTRRVCKPFYIPTRVFIETSEDPVTFHEQGGNGDCVHCPHYFGHMNYCDYYKMDLNGNGYEPTCQNQ